MSPKLLRLAEYFDRYGWTVEADEGGMILTGWSDDLRSYPMIAYGCDSWITLEVSPLVIVPDDWANHVELVKLVNTLNRDGNMIKLFVDVDDFIGISTQISTKALNFEVFSEALGVLGHFAQKYFDILSTSIAEIEGENRYLS